MSDVRLDIIYRVLGVIETTYSGSRACLRDPGLVQLVSSRFRILSSALTAFLVFAKINDGYVRAAGSVEGCCRYGEENKGAPG